MVKQDGPGPEIKPVSFERGVPKAQQNGLYGMEQQLLDNPGDQVVAVVTYSVRDDVTKAIKGERYPIVGIDAIEPLHDPDAIKMALQLKATAYQQRSGDNELAGIDEVDD